MHPFCTCSATVTKTKPVDVVPLRSRLEALFNVIPPPAAPLLLCSDLARMVTCSTGFNERRDVFLQHITGCLQCRWRHTADVAIATTTRAAFAGVAAATTATAPARTVASPLTHLRFCAGGPRVAKLGVKTTVGDEREIE